MQGRPVRLGEFLRDEVEHRDPELLRRERPWLTRIHEAVFGIDDPGGERTLVHEHSKQDLRVVRQLHHSPTLAAASRLGNAAERRTVTSRWTGVAPRAGHREQ